MRQVLPLVAALAVAVSVSQAQPSATINIINHNIKSGTQPQAAADHIEDLLNLTPQKAMVLLNEANQARQHFTLPHPNWHHHWPASPHEGRGNAIFTRDAAVTILDSWVMNMTQPWTHNQPKDPRVYPAVKAQLATAPWVQFNCVTVHFPTIRTGNNPARQESVDRLIQLSNNNPDIPLIICGDFNMGAQEARTRIANVIGGQLYSDASVDHIIVRDGKNIGFDPNVTVTRMGLMGSDHQALRYNFTFRLKNLVLDNSDTGFTASSSWSTGTSAADKYGSNYRFRATDTVSDTAKWAFNVPVAGNYEIFAWWNQGSNRSITAPYVLPDSSIVYKNQQTGGGAWQSLGVKNLSAGTNNIQLSCWTSNGTIVVGDAIRLVPQ